MTMLRSSILVQALIRRAQVAGAFVLVRQHGDDDAGSVLVLVNTLDGRARLLGPARDADFNRVWGHECEDGAPYELAETILQKRMGQDPDIWVVEIEDRQGRHFLTEKILDRE
jgi:hypothetical protein